MPDTPKKLRVIDTPDPERPPAEPELPREKLKLGTKQITEVNRPIEATTKPITVHEILAENLRHTVPAEKPLDLRKPRSRRKRDYWVLMLIGNAILGSGAYFFPHNPVVLAFVIGGCTVFTISITWIMWQVMSNY